MRSWVPVLVLLGGCGAGDPLADCTAAYSTDGGAHVSRTETYDDRGRVVLLQYYDSVGSMSDHVETTWTDDDQIETQRVVSVGGDLISSLVYVFEGGRAVRMEADNDGDGNPESVTTFTYEGDDPVLAETDVGNDGDVDWSEIRTFEAGLMTSNTYDYPDDGPDVRYSWSYDADGHEIEATWDAGADGTIESLTTYVWDGDLRMREDIDGENDGDIDYTRVWAYDEAGRPVSVDRFEDDTLVETETITWTCPG